MTSNTYRVPFEVPQIDFATAMQHLRETKRFGIQPMLECVEDMLEELARPESSFDCIQIAGTNGKTSTSRYLTHILMGEGLKAALYTSPELVSYTERMEIDGATVSPEAFAHGIACAVESGRRVNERRVAAGIRPYDITEFDLITVAALVIYAEANIDVAVLECGMGGRWDATSAASSIKVVGITGVGLDHTHILGDTVEAIAAEKAATIKSGRACVLGVGTQAPPSVDQVFMERCREVGVEPVVVVARNANDVEGLVLEDSQVVHDELFGVSFEVLHEPSKLGDTLMFRVETPFASYRELGALKPRYQAANITLALALAEQYLKRALDEDKLALSIVSCPTPGRFDLRRPDPIALIDACHNPQSVEVFLTAVRAIEPSVETRPALLCAALADKDVAGMVSLLAREFPRIYVTQTSSDRALPADELASLFAQAGVDVEAVFATVDEALQALSDVGYIACGSITLAGEVAALYQRSPSQAAPSETPSTAAPNATSASSATALSATAAPSANAAPSAIAASSGFDDALADALILVDVLDREVGQLDKLTTHQQGLLHRAFSVFLYRDNKILIQRRAYGKYHSGGLWANACCSHPRAGESLSQALPRRLKDELGATANKICELDSYVYRHEFENGLVEHEYDHVFVGELQGSVQPNPDEIAEIRWIGLEELVSELREKPETFAAWFEGVCAIALPEIAKRFKSHEL